MIRYIKRGLTTLTTIGCLTGFESHVCRYFTLRSRDSVEAAVLVLYDNDSGPFARAWDSRSIIGDALGKFIASSPGARVQPFPLTSRLVCQCTGSGRSSRASSLVPTSTLTMTTRFVSSFCLILSYL